MWRRDFRPSHITYMNRTWQTDYVLHMCFYHLCMYICTILCMYKKKRFFFYFSCMFLNPNMFSNLNYNYSNLLDMKNLQEQVKKAFCYHQLFWTFTIWINCSADLKIFVNSQPSASNFKSFSRSLHQFFLAVGQNDFCNKIPFPR